MRDSNTGSHKGCPYNMFRSAGIIQGVYKRGLDGNASSEHALEQGGIARRRAESGWRLVQEMLQA